MSLWEWDCSRLCRTRWRYLIFLRIGAVAGSALDWTIWAVKKKNRVTISHSSSKHDSVFNSLEMNDRQHWTWMDQSAERLEGWTGYIPNALIYYHIQDVWNIYCSRLLQKKFSTLKQTILNLEMKSNARTIWINHHTLMSVKTPLFHCWGKVPTKKTVRPQIVEIREKMLYLKQ